LYFELDKYAAMSQLGPYPLLNICMSREALNDIQKALNVIRNATDKEQYETKVKALELMTQAMLSHIKALEPEQPTKKTTRKQPPKLPPPPIPKSANTPNPQQAASASTPPPTQDFQPIKPIAPQ
jgi:hypothetical protein